MFGFLRYRQLLALFIILKREIMSELDNVKAAIAALNTSLTAEIQAVSDKIGALQNAGGASAADLEDLKTQIDAATARIDAETAALTAPARESAPSAG